MMSASECYASPRRGYVTLGDPVLLNDHQLSRSLLRNGEGFVVSDDQEPLFIKRIRQVRDAACDLFPREIVSLQKVKGQNQS